MPYDWQTIQQSDISTWSEYQTSPEFESPLYSKKHLPFFVDKIPVGSQMTSGQHGVIFSAEKLAETIVSKQLLLILQLVKTTCNSSPVKSGSFPETWFPFPVHFPGRQIFAVNVVKGVVGVLVAGGVTKRDHWLKWMTESPADFYNFSCNEKKTGVVLSWSLYLRCTFCHSGSFSTLWTNSSSFGNLSSQS